MSMEGRVTCNIQSRHIGGASIWPTEEREACAFMNLAAQRCYALRMSWWLRLEGALESASPKKVMLGIAAVELCIILMEGQGDGGVTAE
jgi:hypothetical protein